MTCTSLIGIALITVLIERFVLEGRIGRTALFAASTNAAASLPGAGIVAGMLTAGAAGAWLTIPLGASWCYPIALIGVILAAALGAESAFARRCFFPVLNRIFTRAAVVSSLLGIVILVPQVNPGLSFVKSITTALLAGAVFAVTRLLYYGVRERIRNGRPGAASVAQELVAAGLLALALAGISTLNFFH
jgi:Na+-translocating ferredoxin:NAD+ oxidoreductase RnfA subunit